MKIEVKKDKLFYGGKYHTHIKVVASCQGAMITEDDMSEGEFEEMVTNLIQDSEFLGDSHWNMIDKLITLGLISEQQVWQWVEDNSEE